MSDRLPFEGLFGTTAELKILEYLLPLEGIEFNIIELSKDNDLTDDITTEVVKKFVDYGILTKRYVKGTEYYAINSESSIIELIEELNNIIIEKLLGEDMLYQIHDYWRIRSDEMN